MIPFGLLSGFMDSKEIRITELGENGFRFRLAEECPEPERFLICFYDMKKAGYRKVEIRKFEMNAVAGTSAAEEWCVQENDGSFFREYSVRVEQKDYMEEVQRLAGEYNRYIRLKLEGDDGELAKALTGYPAELDEVHCESLEEQRKLWFGENSSAIKRTPEADQSVEGLFWDRETEFALELNNTSLYEEYLRQLLKDFLASYWQKNYLTHSWLAGRTPERFYIGNQFCHNLFPTEEQLFSIMDKMRSEGLEITLAFSYIREFMLPSVGKLLEKVDNWCCIHGMNVEIVVNDWAVAEMLDYADPTLRAAGFAPYYLYRQKYMSGSFENVGWCISGAEGLYNIYIMEELHSILSLGAGGSTKMVDIRRDDRIDRVFHPKYPTEYIQRQEQVAADLEKFAAFHREMLENLGE